MSAGHPRPSDSVHPDRRDRPPVLAGSLPLISTAELLLADPDPAVLLETVSESERTSLGRASAGRTSEFADGRRCAAAALRRLGVPVQPVLRGDDRAPRWPAGVVGALTHCEGFRAAAVGPSARYRSVGIDAEPDRALPDDVAGYVLTTADRLALGAPGLPQHAATIVFSAKESVYKTWYPLARCWLDFGDADIALRARDERSGTFDVRLRGCAESTVPHHFDGHWQIARGIISTLVALPA